MVEIRTYDGDMRQLSEFCTQVWARRYQGRMPYALWSADFFEWELEAGPTSRDYLVAAYDGARLVGFLAARPLKFHLRGEVVDGTWSSYFSVDSDYENQPVALKLSLELRRRHRQRGARVCMGYVYMSYSAARGKDFWLRQPKVVKQVRRLGLWVRVLDPPAIARFSLRRIEAFGARVSQVVLGGPSKPRQEGAIRPFVPADAAACAELLDAESRRCELGYAWDAAFAARQLGFERATRTLVVEREGRVAGLINYCPLELFGRTSVVAGVIDFLVTRGLPTRTGIDLVRAALTDMKERGMHIAMALRISGMPWWPLARCGFTMMPPEYHYVAQPVDFELPDWRMRRLHVHWR